jgi:hypothetical protein
VSQPSGERIRRALETAAEQHANVLQSLEEQLLAIAAGERDRELRRTADVVRAAQAEVARIAEVTDRAEDERALGVVVEALRDLDEAESLHDVLSRLARHAEGIAGRAELVMIDRHASRDWERAVAVSGIEAGRLVREAAESGGVASAGADVARQALAMPLVVAGEVVAVLYVEALGEGRHLSARVWPQAVEILARHASRCLEAVTARKASRASVQAGSDPL